MPPSPVIHLADLTLTEQTHGDTFAARFAPVTPRTGSPHIGARLTEVPPGKRAWPHHCHHANDEMFVILSGSGTLRFGEETHAITAGDVAICPAGGVDTAHQIINTGSEPLRYLAISSMNQPDVMEYPDSNKLFVVAGSPPGGDKSKRTAELIVKRDAGVDYWDGEG
jgi:uncharacterized cupin superfamily protein